MCHVPKNTINVVCNHPEAMCISCSQFTHSSMSSEVLEPIPQGIFLI